VNGKPMVGGISLEVLAGIAGIVIVVAVGTLIAKRKAAATEPAADRPKS
jgi:hypothetical protein